MNRRSLKKRFLAARPTRMVFSFLASIVMRFIRTTCRFSMTTPDAGRLYITGQKPAIFCFWHGRMIMHPFVKPRGRALHVLISHHNDGSLITATLRWFGIDSVRGSPNRGSNKALRRLLSITARRDNICITPDGPRGPFQQAAPGAAFVAAKTGYALVPVTFSATRYWQLKSWDRFIIPKPFSRIIFILGEPIAVADDNADTLMQTTAHLQRELNRITAEADSAIYPSPHRAANAAPSHLLRTANTHARVTPVFNDTLRRLRFPASGAEIVRLAYAATGYIITPALVVWLRRRARRGKENTARMAERFGHASIARPQGKLIWLHAASVGETQSVLTLVRALLKQHPATHMLITTGTVTSAGLVAQQNLPQVLHQFIPVDTAPAVRRFLAHWQPDLALWVESEFWPQLLWQTARRAIPMLLINARLSAVSYDGWRKWPRTIRSLFASFTGIYAGSADDAMRLTALGATNVQDVGNLKYDAEPLPIGQALLCEMAKACAARPVWVAASTHANEEQMIAQVHASLTPQFPDLLTIIIPRHASRGDSIARELRAQSITVAQRSKAEPITSQTGIYLADTMGELGSFYRVAEIVFLGGSLIAHGGHNPLEPARLSCALLTGPHTHNFTTIMDHLRAAEAIGVVQDKEMLRTMLAMLFTDDAMRLGLAERALAATQDASGASTIILQRIGQLLQGGYA